MLASTVGQVLVNDALPEPMRNYSRVLNKKTSKALFQELADKYPDRYRDISHRLVKLGGQSAFETGGFSFGLRHMALPKESAAYREMIRQEVQQIRHDTSLSDTDRDAALIAVLKKHAKPFADKIYKEALAEKNPIALQIESGAKGSPANLMSILGGDLMYEGHKGQPIPFPILHSYAEGYSPAEYWASTYGVRKGLIDLKAGTQDAGYFGKQLNQLTHRLIVTKHDADAPDDYLRGFPVDTADTDNEGALLAKDIGHYKRNTRLTPAILAELQNKGHKRILVRSAITSNPPDGGIYARDAGIRERGGLPPIGDYVGMGAAQALAEPVTQATISSKHTGGVAGAGAATSGFRYINQLVQVPKIFSGGAAHAQNEGRVGAITPAPAGGTYVMVGTQRHYVPQGQAPTVTTGDTVEPGDVMSDGLPNPAEIVHHKGIGEGRKYFIDAMRQVYKNSGIRAHRRNLELLSRGLINHIRLTDIVGDYMPDDVVPYDVFEHDYQPRPDHDRVAPRKAIGQYLEQPVLHHTIGTKIRPSMLHDLEHFGVNNVIVHKDPPPFVPDMIRSAESLQHDRDWQTRMLGSNLKKSTLGAAHRGAVSDIHGTSFVPALAAAKPFAREGPTQGWKTNQPGQSPLGGMPI